VYYERPGDFQGQQLKARGVTTVDLVRHWLFTTEYQWQILCHNDDTAKSISVIDIEHFKINDLAGENLNFLKKTIGYANQHYPERSYVIYVVNAPFYASMLWKIVKPMVHENTQRKVRILSKSETLKGLQEHIDLSQIPVYYGGELQYPPPTDYLANESDDQEKNHLDSCRYYSPDVIEMNGYVRQLNDGGAGNMLKSLAEKANNNNNNNDNNNGGDSSSGPTDNNNGNISSKTVTKVPFSNNNNHNNSNPPGKQGDMGRMMFSDSSQSNDMNNYYADSNVSTPQGPPNRKQLLASKSTMNSNTSNNTNVMLNRGRTSKFNPLIVYSLIPYNLYTLLYYYSF
jgi:hypothetical protein